MPTIKLTGSNLGEQHLSYTSSLRFGRSGRLRYQKDVTGTYELLQPNVPFGRCQ